MRWVLLSFLLLIFAWSLSGCAVNPEDFLGDLDSTDNGDDILSGTDKDTSIHYEDGDTGIDSDTMENSSTDGDGPYALDSEAAGRSDSDSIYTIETDIIEGTDSAARRDGHWSCEGNICLPVYENDSCGDGVCQPTEGESVQSCRGDCLRPAGDMSCNSDIDCVFLEWEQSKDGWWECEDEEDSEGGTCTAVAKDDWCNHKDQICTAEEGESSQSCPADCKEAPSCETAVDCLFNVWPG